MSQGPSSSPETSMAPYLPDNTLGIQGGLYIPLRSGAYVGIGAAQRRLDNVLEDGSGVWQSVTGARINMPLLRDRGFALQASREEQYNFVAQTRMADYQAAVAFAAHNSALAFAYELYTAALLRQYEKALHRVESLLSETERRVELETTAKYQLYPAEMNVHFKIDDLRQYAAVYTNAHNSLELAAGGVKLPYSDAKLLKEWAKLCLSTDIDTVIANEGGLPAEIKSKMRELEYNLAREKELSQNCRSSLTLSVGVGYQGENENFGFGSDNLLRDDNMGADISLVWSRPISFEGADTALRAQRARTRIARENLRLVTIEFETKLKLARELFAAAKDRMILVDKAVAAAEKVLNSETERLKLGEGRSRNVLDAQTDLTAAEGRANLASYDVICTFLDIIYTSGVFSGKNNDLTSSMVVTAAE